MFAHLGTNDLRETERRLDAGDEAARAVFKGMAYVIAKNIASLVPALADDRGRVGLAAVVLTGGMARSQALTGELRRLCASLGPVEVVEEDEEMTALATGVVRVLRGEETQLSYHRDP
jgi:butyrate kinase